MSAGNDLITLRAVSAGYGKVHVVHDVDLQVAACSHVALIGPNGAGKTTLLRLMAGDLQAAAGQVEWQGQPLDDLAPRQRAQRIAYVPPTLDLSASLSVWDFVALGRTPHAGPWQRLRDADHRAVAWAIEQMQLSDFAERWVHTLSEGERHRAMIALALTQEPKILLLDEPTAHLDLRHAWRTMELVDDLHRECGLTLVQATHDLNIAAAFASRVVLMSKGKIALQGNPADVLSESLLSDVYEIPIQVMRTVAGMHILPSRTKSNES